jgi:hypothetical protein
LIALTATVTSGKNIGKTQIPTIHQDGKYVASTTRFKVDYIRVDSIEELTALMTKGLSIRMNCVEPKTASSLISPASINIESTSDERPQTAESYLIKFADEENLDRQIVAQARKEQAFLRTVLTQGENQHQCCICQQILPVEMLVAAHIKRRTNCNLEEKKDFKNVATLMCKLGCDDLFENGYIAVSNGKIVQNEKRAVTPYLQKHIVELLGLSVDNWAQSGKYYEWHAEFHLGRDAINRELKQEHNGN